jgi:Tn3 transposase DDE domain
LSISPLDRMDEPPTLRILRRQIENLLPEVDLTDALLEVQGFTHFADAFVSVNPAEPRPKDFALSLCAVLIGEACNIGLEPREHSNLWGAV